MTLSFSQNWPERMGELAGQPNCFVEKIWEGLTLDDDMTKGMFERSKFIDDLIKIAENERHI